MRIEFALLFWSLFPDKEASYAGLKSKEINTLFLEVSVMVIDG